MVRSCFDWIKKNLDALRYSYQHFISHSICLGLGFIICEIIDNPYQKEGFPVNSIILTLDKNKFKNNIEAKKEDFLFITKADSKNSYFCKTHSHPIKLINIYSNSYSFRLKKDDLASIKKQILDSKSPYVLNLENTQDARLCYESSSRVRYE